MTAKKLLSKSLMLLLISSSMNVFGLSTELENDLKDSVVLFANSNMAYSNNTDTYIDTSNKEVKALVKNGRTLIPLRFVSENFGAQVSFDTKTSTATITANGNKVKLTSNNKTMLVGDKKVLMDEPAQIINGRMLVPLRALAENALGKDVFYDNGLIVISQTKKSLDSQKINELFTKFNNSASSFAYQLSKPIKGDMVAVMKTNFGDIKIKLFYEDAPIAVENFVKLSQKGYYNNLIFHRVINNFMIQGGDPKGNGTGGESIWGKPFSDEFSKRLYNIRGALSMANSGANTNGSQFFIVQNPLFNDELKENCKSIGMDQKFIDEYSKVGGTPWLDGRHSVFGQVYEGMDIVDKIAAVKTGVNDKPVDDVKLLSVQTYKLGYEGQNIVFEKSAFDPSAKTKAPDFQLENADGKKVKLSDYKGKTVVLNFWATWCGPCKNEMPDINKAAGEIAKSKDAVLLTVNIGETKDVAVKFMKDNGYNMNLLLDSKMEIANKYGVSAIPTTIVIDKNGNIADQIVGATTYKKLMEILNNNRK
ncbi:peptidylprolyl isomerase [Pseudobacteroides cellulosolvens]|uniref:peptidylprolyl isomerase n=1 Tax=Pseudobacteroides cellulosolvens ATCC 35603 = DSM 2933 TaxID=398512 RepID=A0A0L6JHP1_9FIRM|nr:peptidylprolyl isomerase [Pseudobacteroides cellulosolvens]KNY25215.1 Peptidylprolyl isomerase [Pseudobacteroides cellulosolvens ATCC 35603 = DSM 2933]